MNELDSYRVVEKFPGCYLIYNGNAEDLMVARQNLAIKRSKENETNYEKLFNKIKTFISKWSV